jgi:U3 small nucleolar RNA-associated protein 24
VQEGEQIEAKKEGGGRQGKSCPQSVSVPAFCQFSISPSAVRPQIASSLFLAHNTALVPPYRVLIDTNFINFSLQNKLELVSGMMDCLYAKCTSFRSSLASGTSHGAHNYARHTLCNGLRDGRIRETWPPLSRRASVRARQCIHYLAHGIYRVARDPRFERLRCSHTGTYADDCLVQRVTAHKCYVVATCDRELRRRIRQIPGVPLMYIVRRRYAIERLPDQGAPT